MAQGKKADGAKKKPRGRPATLLLSEELRTQIDARKIIKRLAQHIDNEVKMLPTQVMAAKILLAKCMPDLTHLDVAATLDKTVTVNVVSFADLTYDDEGKPIYGETHQQDPQPIAH